MKRDLGQQQTFLGPAKIARKYPEDSTLLRRASEKGVIRTTKEGWIIEGLYIIRRTPYPAAVE